MEKEVVFLALTIAIEFPVAMFVLGKQDWKRIGLAVVCVNLVTHPIAWQFAATGTAILPIEVAVTLTESILLALVFTPHRYSAFLAGFAMNVVSAMIGVILF